MTDEQMDYSMIVYLKDSDETAIRNSGTKSLGFIKIQNPHFIQ